MIATSRYRLAQPVAPQSKKVIPHHASARLAEPCGDVHPLGHVDRGTTHIDGATARAKRAIAFHNGHAVTVTRQPIGQCATRNAGS